jgi:hypothetical protein
VVFDRFEAFLNQGAQIDGMGAGDWCVKYHPLFVGMPPSAPAETGTKFIYWPNWSNDPYSFTERAWTVSADGSGNLTTATIASGEIDISVTDLSGKQATSFKTDLSATTISANPFVMNLTGTLSPGPYTLSASSQGITVAMPVIIPKSAFLRLTGTVYAVLMDANGNAASGSLVVSGGTLLDSGNGYAIVAADAMGTVVVNKRSKSLRMKSDLRTVQELLGYKTIAMTVRYSHLEPQPPWPQSNDWMPARPVQLTPEC